MNPKDLIDKTNRGLVTVELANQISVIRRTIDRAQYFYEPEHQVLEDARPEYRKTTEDRSAAATAAADGNQPSEDEPDSPHRLLVYAAVLGFEPNEVRYLQKNDYRTYVQSTAAGLRRRERYTTLMKTIEHDVQQDKNRHSNTDYLCCFNELGYPGIDTDGEDLGFVTKVQGIVEENGLILIGGTYHDPSSQLNLCKIFGPANDRKRDDLHKHGHLRAYAHPKLRSAGRIGEYVRTPSLSDQKIFEGSFGLFEVLICIDSLDANVVYKIARGNTAYDLDRTKYRPRHREHLKIEETKIDRGDGVQVRSAREPTRFIFVPAYHGERSNDKLKRACADLSYLSSTVVISADVSKNAQSNSLFVAGQEIRADSNEPFCTIRELYAHDQNSPTIGEAIIKYEFNLPLLYNYLDHMHDKLPGLVTELMDEAPELRKSGRIFQSLPASQGDVSETVFPEDRLYLADNS